MPSILHPDPFSPVLLSSTALRVSPEQRNFIREILEIACSDSKFAEKAYRAIELVLTAGSVVPPVIVSLDPPSAVLGSPSFTLRVSGTGFTPGSVIMFNGSEEPTTFVSNLEVTTEVDMSTAGVAVAVPVAVLNPDGVLSDPMNFTFLESAPEILSVVTEKKTPVLAGKK
jgi:hypothetical protein